MTEDYKSLTNWDLRFIRIAEEVATWSKDPGTKVGAVLVDDRRIVSQGYNGFAQRIADTIERYNDRETKLAFTVHAEVNAILNAARNGSRTENSTLYVTFSPCAHCASSVIQAGIRRVVCPCLSIAPQRWRQSFELGQSLLTEAGIMVTTYIPKSNV